LLLFLCQFEEHGATGSIQVGHDDTEDEVDDDYDDDGVDDFYYVEEDADAGEIAGRYMSYLCSY